MGIRYRRVGLKIERVDDGLGAAAAQVALQAEIEAARTEGMQLADRADHLRVRLNRFARETRHRIALRQRLFPKAVLAANSEPAPAAGVAPREVRLARTVAAVSQRELASRLGVHRSSIAEAERGTRTASARLTAWTQGVLRAHGNAKGGNHADDADEGAAGADGGAG
jgi:DNA-binding XRE family transcriptional regulator